MCNPIHAQCKHTANITGSFSLSVFSAVASFITFSMLLADGGTGA
jgi:hypothetical protein